MDGVLVVCALWIVCCLPAPGSVRGMLPDTSFITVDNTPIGMLYFSVIGTQCQIKEKKENGAATRLATPVGNHYARQVTLRGG